MNRRTSILVACFIVLVVSISLAIGLAGGQTAGNTCGTNGKPSAYIVTIKNTKVSNAHVRGKLCDTLKIVNKDMIIREVAFGPHEHHASYDSVTERVLGEDQSLTITLNQAGSFHWHDHIHDEVEGFFTVTK